MERDTEVDNFNKLVILLFFAPYILAVPGAGSGNRTRTNRLEICCSTIKPYPHFYQKFNGQTLLTIKPYQLESGMPDSNWRPHGPKPCALPTEPIPDWFFKLSWPSFASQLSQSPVPMAGLSSTSLRINFSSLILLHSPCLALSEQSESNGCRGRDSNPHITNVTQDFKSCAYTIPPPRRVGIDSAHRKDAFAFC